MSSPESVLSSIQEHPQPKDMRAVANELKRCMGSLVASADASRFRTIVVSQALYDQLASSTTDFQGRMEVSGAYGNMAVRYGFDLVPLPDTAGQDHPEPFSFVHHSAADYREEFLGEEQSITEAVLQAPQVISTRLGDLRVLNPVRGISSISRRGTTSLIYDRDPAEVARLIDDGYSVAEIRRMPSNPPETRWLGGKTIDELLDFSRTDLRKFNRELPSRCVFELPTSVTLTTNETTKQTWVDVSQDTLDQLPLGKAMITHLPNGNWVLVAKGRLPNIEDSNARLFILPGSETRVAAEFFDSVRSYFPVEELVMAVQLLQVRPLDIFTREQLLELVTDPTNQFTPNWQGLDLSQEGIGTVQTFRYYKGQETGALTEIRVVDSFGIKHSYEFLRTVSEESE